MLATHAGAISMEVLLGRVEEGKWSGKWHRWMHGANGGRATTLAAGRGRRKRGVHARNDGDAKRRTRHAGQVDLAMQGQSASWQPWTRTVRGAGHRTWWRTPEMTRPATRPARRSGG